MINKIRRKHTPEFKAGIVLELFNGKMTVPQLAKKHRIKDSLVYEWRREAVDRLPVVFMQRAPDEVADQHVADLERLIGQQTVEIEALKKVSKWLTRASKSSERS
ncbi:MAG: transposase [Thermoflexales bacterium]